MLIFIPENKIWMLIAYNRNGRENLIKVNGIESSLATVFQILNKTKDPCDVIPVYKIPNFLGADNAFVQLSIIKGGAN